MYFLLLQTPQLCSLHETTQGGWPWPWEIQRSSNLPALSAGFSPTPQTVRLCIRASEKGEWDSREFLYLPPPEILVPVASGMWNRRTELNPSTAISVNLIIRDDNLNLFHDIQISAVCYHFIQHSKHQ